MQYLYALVRPLGVLCVLVALATWSMDWMDLVAPCTYCRFQRSIIAVLGLILIYRRPNVVLEYLAWVIGAFGLYLASRQFMDNYLQSFFTKPNFYLSGCSLLLQVAALFAITHLERFKQEQISR